MMDSFSNKGKYEHIKFKYDADMSILEVDVAKKKIEILRDKKHLA